MSELLISRYDKLLRTNRELIAERDNLLERVTLLGYTNKEWGEGNKQLRADVIETDMAFERLKAERDNLLELLEEAQQALSGWDDLLHEKIKAALEDKP
jgi:hypothetical protein